MAQARSSLWYFVSAVAILVYPMSLPWMIECIQQMNYLDDSGHPRSTPQFLFYKVMLRRFYRQFATRGGDIAPQAHLGEGIAFVHGFNGVHIAKQVVIGRNCMIGQNVTLGVNIARAHDGRAPRTGDNVFIGVGVNLIGACVIGDGAKIGAGVTLVNATVPPGATIVDKSAYDLTNKRYVYPQD